jgi:hypothetical protein
MRERASIRMRRMREPNRRLDRSLIDSLDESLGRLAWHSDGRVQCHARATLAACTLLTLGALVYAAATRGLGATEIACSLIVWPALFQIAASRRPNA